MDTLVIAEKPSVGRDIARVLGARSKGEGFFHGGGYIVSWAVGHLVELAEPEDYHPSYKRWRDGPLPIVPQEMRLRPIEETQRQLGILKGLLSRKGVGEVVCATDSGREGELIFRYIYALLGCKLPFRRLWISSMTDEAIREGFANLRDSREYDALYSSAKCRSEADWLVGINATRAFTLRYGTLLSIGRVQTPTLALLAMRQKEIDAFVPKEYYEVRADFCVGQETGEDKAYHGTYFRIAEGKRNTHVDTLEAARAIVEAVKGSAGRIASLEKRTERKPPPLLYDLTELQRDANRIYGHTAAKVLEAAQALYEAKMITYPRTDSRHLSSDISPKIRGILDKLSAEYGFVAAIDAEGIGAVLLSGQRVVDDVKVSDHHAIIPTGASRASLGILEGQVYDLVLRRFAQVFYPAYVHDITTIVTDIGGHGFVSKGKVVVEPGWTSISPTSPRKKSNSARGEQSLPNLEMGEGVLCKSAKHQHKRTKPPDPYTEATLLSAMEHAGRFIEELDPEESPLKSGSGVLGDPEESPPKPKGGILGDPEDSPLKSKSGILGDPEELRRLAKQSGLGTPATRAATIERLIQVGYVRRAAKNLVITPKGALLIEVVPPELKTPETTGRWEKGLGSIARGGLTSERFMQSISRYVHYIVDFAQHNAPPAKFPQEPPKYKKRSQ